MGTNISLTVPDHIYQWAEQVARDEQRSITEVLNEVLSQAFLAVHVNPDRAAMEAELKAFRTMNDELREDYSNQYVAVYQGRVVDSDADRVALVARIERRYPDEVVLIRCADSDVDALLNMPSPRIVR